MSKVTFIDEEEFQINRERKLHKMRVRKLTIIKQKLIGIALVTIGIVTPLLLDGDATASVFLIPTGLYLVGCNSVIR